MSTIETLLDQGWQECPDQFRKYARCFYKQFDTPTRCACNNDKEGIQVCVAVSEQGYEIDLCGELQDGTWIKLHQWLMPKEIKAGLALIPRMIATWKFIANYE